MEEDLSSVAHIGSYIRHESHEEAQIHDIVQRFLQLQKHHLLHVHVQNLKKKKKTLKDRKVVIFFKPEVARPYFMYHIFKCIPSEGKRGGGMKLRLLLSLLCSDHPKDQRKCPHFRDRFLRPFIFVPCVVWLIARPEKSVLVRGSIIFRDKFLRPCSLM